MVENPSVKVNWIYYSYEIDRVRKEKKMACFFLNHDYGITNVQLPLGVKYKGNSVIPLSPRYIDSRMKDDNDNLIIIDPEIERKLEEIYENRIVPMFGRYDQEGRKLSRGAISFITARNNPTGRFKQIVDYASTIGEFSNHDSDHFKRLDSGYTPGDESYNIIITDHIRKIKPERQSQGWGMKQVIDKDIEYQVEMRNKLGFTFVDICHLNRELGDISRIKYLNDRLHPTGDNFKD